MTLKAALTDAVRKDELLRNPCDKVKAPKKGASGLGNVSYDDACKLAVHDGLEPVHVTALLMLQLGLRRSEVLALRKDDVNFEHRSIVIQRSVARLLDGTLATKENKTPKSRRVMPIGNAVYDVLRQYTDGLGASPLLFPHHAGAIWHLETFSSALVHHFKALGITGTAHRLRHTFSTEGQKVAQTVAISRAMGHSQVTTTSNHYTHTNDVEVRKAIEDLETALRKAR